MTKPKSESTGKTSKPSAKTTKPKASTSASKSAKPRAAAKTSRTPATKKEPAKPARTEELVGGVSEDEPVFRVTEDDGSKDAGLSPFLKKQKSRLLNLRDALLDSMQGVARDNLRSRAEGSEASAFGLHQADAGSDAYDRDFALSLLSQEQDALYEIEEALKRVEFGTYGVCEMSGKNIPHARLEAMPFARYTVECQAQLEKQNRNSRSRQSVTSLFGLGDDDRRDSDDDNESFDTKE